MICNVLGTLWEKKMNNKIKKPSETIKFSDGKSKAFKLTVIIPILLYLFLYYLAMRTASSSDFFTVYGNRVPIASLAGIINSIANISLICMTLFYKKAGFIAASILLLLGVPMYVSGVIVSHNFASITGFIQNIFTYTALVIIHMNQKKMHKNHRQMKNLFGQTATSLINAIDAKDKYTHGHSARVAEYSFRLAQMNGKNSKECEQVYYAALLHDVGKIGVPSYIINKPGKLTNEEYEMIKEHPTLGAQILENIYEYPFLKTGAHYHHERYDGKGYPGGLKGEEIPEIARIIAVADAYDAMTSIRSYRDPISQDKVREEIFKGIGTQFDPVYAKLMLQMIDTDTEYDMKEKDNAKETKNNDLLSIGKYRSNVTKGIHITNCMTAIRLTVEPNGNSAGKSLKPSMVLFDSLDGIVHTDEREIDEYLYFEYGEIWTDGHTETEGARKIQTKVNNDGSADIKDENEYKIEAVRIKDHAMIRISGKKQTAEIIAALPDSSRFMYIGLTGEHCSISIKDTVKSEKKCPVDFIPRIAEEISFINVPAGDMPNVQIDGFRTDASEGAVIKDGLKLTFHVQSLPTARLVWHCPFVDIYCSDDGRVDGKNYRDIAFLRFDGECWSCDPNCSLELNINKTEEFKDWDDWKERSQTGYDTVVTFHTADNKITVITENIGISITSTVVLNNVNKPVYAAITGDQVAVTNIRVNNA